MPSTDDLVVVATVSDRGLRDRARAELDLVLPDLIKEVAYRLSEALEQLSHARAAARADGSGNSPDEILARARQLADHLGDLAIIANKRSLDINPLLPSRLSIDIATRRINFTPLSA